jgi:NADH oxidase (H2O2-forming)
MEKKDVVVIGGSAAGIVAAVTGKSHYPESDFLVIRKDEQVLVPCGIPYIFGSLDSSDKDIIPDAVLNKAGVGLKVCEVVSIDKDKKICRCADGAEIGYDKLVLAVGSTPKVPSGLEGAGLKNVFTIPKDKAYLDTVVQKIEKCRKIVTIGGGFIGVEVSDELTKRGKKVTIVEILPCILGTAFDKEICFRAREILGDRGVTVQTGTGIKRILGDTHVEGVELNNGQRLDADGIILSMGYRPNTNVAREAGICCNGAGFIKVDEYMRTATRDVFAVGDCVEKRDFFTRKPSPVMLASTACAEARIAGMNLYRLSTLKAFIGTIAIFSTAIGDTAFGAAGLTEKVAANEGFDIVTGSFEGVDKHPGTLRGTSKQFVKLIAGRECGVILGGAAMGATSTGELINMIGLAIQNRMTVNNILSTQIGTHPLLTSPPTAYPFIKAAESIAKKLKSK